MVVFHWRRPSSKKTPAVWSSRPVVVQLFHTASSLHNVAPSIYVIKHVVSIYNTLHSCSIFGFNLLNKKIQTPYHRPVPANLHSALRKLQANSRSAPVTVIKEFTLQLCKTLRNNMHSKSCSSIQCDQTVQVKKIIQHDKLQCTGIQSQTLDPYSRQHR
jgi:hypothetical protein